MDADDLSAALTEAFTPLFKQLEDQIKCSTTDLINELKSLTENISGVNDELKTVGGFILSISDDTRLIGESYVTQPKGISVDNADIPCIDAQYDYRVLVDDLSNRIGRISNALEKICQEFRGLSSGVCEKIEALTGAVESPLEEISERIPRS